MTGALQDTEIDAPGTDSFAILVGHESGELVEVSKVVDRPSGEELAESYRPEGGVAAAAVEIQRLNIQGTELRETDRANCSEFVEQLRQ